MSQYRQSEPAIQALVHLYEVIDTLGTVDSLPGTFEDNKLPIFANEDLNIFILRENGNSFLVSEKEYKGLLPFKIKLGSDQNPFNRRVVNEVRAKLFKVTSTVTKSEVEQFIGNLIEEKLTLVFDFVKNYLKENILALLFRRHSVQTISDFWEDFCEKQGVDAQVSVKRSLFGKYEIRVHGTRYPDTALMKTFFFAVTGKEETVRRDFVKALRKALQE